MQTMEVEKINYIDLDSDKEIHLNDKLLIKKNVLYKINYGNKTQEADIYAPINTSINEIFLKPEKFVIFIQGGKWQVGDKELYYFLGKWFAKNNIYCAIPNFRKYPVYNISDSIEDVKLFIDYIKSNFNLEDKNITLMGHSSGAHICSMILAENNYSFKSYILLSGIFKINPIIRYGCCMSKKESWNKYDILNKISGLEDKFCESNILIAAGEKDYILIKQQSKNLYDILRKKNIKTEYLSVGGANHYECLTGLVFNTEYFEHIKSKNSNIDINLYRKSVLNFC